jgi:hypothetical protein
MHPHIEHFLASLGRALERKGLAFRFVPEGSKIYLFASHPYGIETSMTVEMVSDGWAQNERGTLCSPHDCAALLVGKHRAAMRAETET